MLKTVRATLSTFSLGTNFMLVQLFARTYRKSVQNSCAVKGVICLQTETTARLDNKTHTYRYIHIHTHTLLIPNLIFNFVVAVVSTYRLEIIKWLKWLATRCKHTALWIFFAIIVHYFSIRKSLKGMTGRSMAFINPNIPNRHLQISHD